MNIQQLINDKIEQHNFIMAGNPGITSIRWEINDIPYKLLKEWREENNTTGGLKMDAATYGNHVRVLAIDHILPIIPSGMVLFLRSAPVKLKTTVEVIEEELA